MPASLAALFGARSVAIVGASDENHYARAVFENLRRLGFPLERIACVNPNRETAFGLRCVASVAALPSPVELAAIVTPAATVAGIVRDCARAGISGCVVLSAGFAEADEEGRRRQDEVAAAARDGGIALVGPNTMGIAAPEAGLGVWGGDLPAGLRAGVVSCVFQSSGLLNLVLSLLAARRIGVRAAISLGNEATLSLADAAAHLVDDAGTRVLAVFVEAIRDVARFRAAIARADARRLPIVVLRVGRSERARRNVIAHTGALASSGAGHEALLRQHGAVLVSNVDELVEHAALFARAADAPLAGDGVGIVTISGGDVSYLADLAERAGVRLPDPAPTTRDAMAAALHRPALMGNPLDVGNTLRSDPPAFERALDLLASDPQVALVALRLNLPNPPTDALFEGYRRAASLVRARGDPVVFLSRASEPLDPAWHVLFEELGAPFLMEYEHALHALRALVAFRARTPRAIVAPAPSRENAARRILGGAPAGAVLGWRETAALLDAYGIPLARWELVASAEKAVAAAERIGHPVAVKAALAHKSDAGAVRLDLATADAVRLAHAEVRERAPGADVLVQRMERGVVECLAGITVDAAVGPVLAVGLGGVFTEVLGDVALRVLPIDEAELRAMLDELRGSPLLAGARGRPRADSEALIDVLAKLARLAVDAGDLVVEIDLNPLVVRPQGEGVVAVDALVARSKAVATSSGAPYPSSTTP